VSKFRLRLSSRARLTFTAAVALSLAAGAVLVPVAVRAATTITSSDWPTYGHDPQHSFAGVSTLTPSSVLTLKPAWFFPTGDAVTSNPIVVGSTLYVGSWDGNFYALDKGTGKLVWKFQLDQQPAINPSPGNTSPRDVMSDGGLVTDAAWFQPGSGGRPDMVIFGGGYTLYALNAGTGKLLWKNQFTGLPEQAPSPTTDSTRIFSSPVVVGNQVIFGVSSDGEAGHRGYVASANINNGSLIWRFETDVAAVGGAPQNDGCGGVWSSPSLDAARGLVFVGVSDCNNHGLPPYAERVIALHTKDGTVAWVFTPPRLQGVPAGQDPPCDFDFGATLNLGAPDATGAATFLGIGGKDGTYYRLDPATGALVWNTNVVFGGAAGGFIGTTAFDGSKVYGATALGDVATPTCEPGNPNDTPLQEPSMHAFNAAGPSGQNQVWSQQGAQSFGPTTVAGGMTFSGYALGPQVQVRNASTGALLTSLTVASDCFCGITVSGNAVFFGTGSPQQGTGDGIYAFTPLS
jgi:polyvinyl alcohol dehydrogenase (cytochrome)